MREEAVLSIVGLEFACSIIRGQYKRATNLGSIRFFDMVL